LQTQQIRLYLSMAALAIPADVTGLTCSPPTTSERWFSMGNVSIFRPGAEELGIRAAAALFLQDSASGSVLPVSAQ
jgi:hypothetical protein